MKQFVEGVIMMEYLVAALFFLRFFRKTADALFLFFGIAFFILGVSRIAFAFMDPQWEADTLLYIVRLAAFILILWAIINKNRVRAPRS